MTTDRSPNDPAVVHSLQDQVAELARRLAAAEAEAEQLAAVANAIDEAVILYDRNGQPVRANARAAEICGFDPAQHDYPGMIAGLSLRRLDGRPLAPTEMPSRLALRGERQADMPYRLTNLHGREFILLCSAAPVYQNGALVGVATTWRDITERELLAAERARAEHALNRYALISDLTRDIILFLDRANGRILEANQAAVQAYGYRREELLEMSVHDLRAPKTRDLTAEQMKLADREGLLFETAHLRKDGSIFPVEVSSRGATVDGRRTLISVIRDISERQSAAAELEVERGKLRAAIENLPVGVVLGDAAGNIMTLNAAGLRLHDFASEKDMFSRLERYFNEFELCTLDGRVLPVEDWPASQAMRGVFVRDFEVTLHNRVTGTQRIISYSVAPVRNPAGETVLVTYVMVDMTEHKRAEQALRLSETTLREYARRLERSNHDLQEFAYVASHDLQEPLRKIEVFSETLLSSGGERSERDGDYLQRIQSAAKRMRLMVDGLLTLSRVTTTAQPFEPVDLAAVVGEVVSDLEIRFRRSGGRVEVGRLPVVQADALQMRQLFLNLIGNALKYYRPEAPPVVRIAAHPLDADAAAAAGAPALFEITVADNGIGFDERLSEQIFQPFKRLVSRSEYEGAGMGLAICRKIVERHGGTLTAHSTPGEGSRFIFTLPARRG